MKSFYYAINENGDYLFDNFPINLVKLVAPFIEKPNPFEAEINDTLKLARLGRKTNSYGTMYVLTFEEKYIKRVKLFREFIDLSALSLGPLSNCQLAIAKQQSTMTEEFIHNVTSLNGYSIQDLFALIPQKILSENFNQQKEIIKNILIEKPNVTVSTLQKLIKYNLAMKVEFSVFERTRNPSTVVKKIPHSIRGLLLSILQIFIDEFEEKKIEVSLDAGEASERRLEVDDDSLFVSIFYILENSLKYCCPNTKYKIIFKEDKDYFSVLFIMISIKITDDEVHKLTIRGYRSNMAKEINAEGKGIGMYRITKTLKLNDAELEVLPRVNDYKRKIGNIEYEANQFKIKFRGQQNWFK